MVVEAEGVGGVIEKFTLAYADIERARLVPSFDVGTMGVFLEQCRRELLWAMKS